MPTRRFDFSDSPTRRVLPSLDESVTVGCWCLSAGWRIRHLCRNGIRAHVPSVQGGEERLLRSFRIGSVGKDPQGHAPERRGPVVVVLPHPEPGNELGLAQQQLSSARFLFHVSRDPTDGRKSSAGRPGPRPYRPPSSLATGAPARSVPGYGWDVVVAIVSGANRNGQDATARPPIYHRVTYEPNRVGPLVGMLLIR
jgi:hypothetical protein